MEEMRFCLVGWARTDGGAGQDSCDGKTAESAANGQLVHHPCRLEAETPLLMDAEPWIVIVLKTIFLVGLSGRRYVVALAVDSHSQAEIAHQSPKARKKLSFTSHSFMSHGIIYQSKPALLIPIIRKRQRMPAVQRLLDV
jgi:hypothetical protein